MKLSHLIFLPGFGSGSNNAQPTPPAAVSAPTSSKSPDGSTTKKKGAGSKAPKTDSNRDGVLISDNNKSLLEN